MSSLAIFSRFYIHLRKPPCPVFRLTQFARTSSSGINRCLSTSHRCFAKDSSLKYLFVNTSYDLWEECPHGVHFDVGKITLKLVHKLCIIHHICINSLVPSVKKINIGNPVTGRFAPESFRP